MGGKVGGLEGRAVTSRPSGLPAQLPGREDTLAYAVMTGSLQILLSQWPRTEAAF